MELKVRTSEEKAKIRRETRIQRCEAIVSRLRELEKDYTKSDAVAICASEFNVSLPTIYKAKKDYDEISSGNTR